MTQNCTSDLIAATRALGVVLLKHWIMEGTQVLLALEYIEVGSGGTETSMLLIALNTRDMDAFRDEIVEKRGAKDTSTGITLGGTIGWATAPVRAKRLIL